MRRLGSGLLLVLLGVVASPACASVLNIDDPSVDSGLADGAVDADAGHDAPSTVLRVFVTRGKYDANLKNGASAFSGMAGADALCERSAARLGGGPWKAWIHDGADSPTPIVDRLQGNGPWYLVDRKTRVFADRAALMSPPAVAIDVDEDGTKVTSGESAWTGLSKACNVCTVWSTSGGSDGGGGHGIVGSTTATWSLAAGCLPCNASAHLYCFESGTALGPKG